MKKSLKSWMQLITNVSLLFFFGLLSTGLILKFILPSGSGRIQRLSGRGFGGGKPVLTWFGWDRYQWLDGHFYIAMIFSALLIIHLILNWGWIRGNLWGTKQSPQPLWIKILTITIVLCGLSMLFALWSIKAQASA